MQFYKILNDQPISDDNYFWKYSDLRSLQNFKQKVLQEKNQQSPKRPARSRSKTPTTTSKYNKTPIKKDPKPSTEDQRKQKELQECTFKPQLIADNSRYANEIEFLQRCTHWSQQKNKKLEQLKQQEQQINLRECTFKPKISDISKSMINALPSEENKDFYKISYYRKTQCTENHFRQNSEYLSGKKKEGPNSSFLNDKAKYEDAIVKLHKELLQNEINID